MSYADLTSAQWNDLSDSAAGRLARDIAGRHELTVACVENRAYAGRSHRTALFDRGGMRFALVPGGRPALGYDAARFRPAAHQAADYADSAAEFGLPSLTEFVDSMTSPVRDVDMPAMLVAVDAFDPCEVPLAPDDPRVRELVAAAGGRFGGVRTFRSGDGLTVEFDRTTGQVVRARAIREVSYDDAMAGLADLGLRTTTPDEWEWACGAGAATLFRWGDDCPGDGYPYDHRTGPHRQDNLWGLAIGQDPYRHEATTERTVVCGGDGGGATCGGSGFFLGWLTLATAYRDEDFGRWTASDDGYADEILTRPVVELG
ncbi:MULTISPECIES: hypothetical protein [unclassified Micromonospora]|uniref:hypothetical protein n=1 Tax=unclassified Micromonospora TaxID=2617518 RepID=UPI00188E96BE|nr:MULTISPECIES: hypothetical protein [unclassified Micromonospora]MBF5033110.1 hypothetical protein [Micromonospora sp. ANENR4]WBC01048.1 hypothetical protein O7546_17910 [Micromonospora sp. WMMA1976]